MPNDTMKKTLDSDPAQKKKKLAMVGKSIVKRPALLDQTQVR